MAASNSQIDICNRALALIGGRAITSFDTKSAEGYAAATLYEDTVSSLLAGHTWRFATHLQRLSRLAEPPAALWTAAYQIPADALRLRGLWVGSSAVEFDVFGDTVVCDASDDAVVALEYTRRVDERLWSAGFRHAAELKLAALFGGALARDGALLQKFDEMAERALQAARTANSQARSPERLVASRLVGGRF